MSDRLNSSQFDVPAGGGFTKPSMIDELLSRSGNIPKPQERPTTPKMTVKRQDVPNSRQPRRSTATPPARERPDWLPELWTVDYKVREKGISAGSYDKYYIEPVSKRRFRSRKEVEDFLKIEPHMQPAFKSAPVNEIKSAGWAFDPLNIPDHVIWSLVDASTNSWVASIGSLRVDQQTTQNWIDHFNAQAKGKAKVKTKTK